MSLTVDPVSIVLAMFAIVSAVDRLLHEPVIGIGLWLGTMIPICLWEIKRQMQRA